MGSEGPGSQSCGNCGHQARTRNTARDPGQARHLASGGVGGKDLDRQGVPHQQSGGAGKVCPGGPQVQHGEGGAGQDGVRAEGK